MDSKRHAPAALPPGMIPVPNAYGAEWDPGPVTSNGRMINK